MTYPEVGGVSVHVQTTKCVLEYCSMSWQRERKPGGTNDQWYVSHFPRSSWRIKKPFNSETNELTIPDNLLNQIFSFFPFFFKTTVTCKYFGMFLPIAYVLFTSATKPRILNQSPVNHRILLQDPNSLLTWLTLLLQRLLYFHPTVQSVLVKSLLLNNTVVTFGDGRVSDCILVLSL